jgi:hypothetical protein
MNQRKFQEPEIPLSPPPVLQLPAARAQGKKSRKRMKKMRLGEERKRENGGI